MGVLAILVIAFVLQSPRMPPEFERRQILSETVLGKRPATEGEIQKMLEEAIRDPNPNIRRQVVGLLATVWYISSVPQTPAGQEWAIRLVGVADALQPEVAKALDDSDAGVRSEALRAVVMGAGARAHRPGASLPLPLLRMLAAHFEKYTDAAGRAYILTAVQTSYRSEDLEVRQTSLELLKKALHEQDPYVVQSAGHSASRAGASEVLPLLVAQLKNPSHVARMGVAQGIASYGAAARPYLPQLEAALAAETDDITKKTIAGTISVITK